MKKRKQIVKAALIRFKHSKISNGDEKQKCLPALSKSQLHNYFADKMGILSMIIEHIFSKSQQPSPAQPEASTSFKSLHIKLIRMRFNFLYKYHQLSFNSREVIKDERERLKILFDHIYQFECSVVSEILRTGIQGEELQKLNQSSLLLLKSR